MRENSRSQLLRFYEPAEPDSNPGAWTDLGMASMNNNTTFAVQPLWSNEAFDATGSGCVVSR